VRTKTATTAKSACARRTAATAVLALACAISAAAPTDVQAATRRERYTPFDGTGAAKPSLRVTPSFGGDCNSASFIVRGDVFRCFDGNFIRDPCYHDLAASEQLDRDVVLCVPSPWSHSAVRLRADSLNDTGALPVGAPPWALELAGAVRCVFAEGATNVVAGRRLNYVCTHNRFGFGVPDTSHATWRIRLARDFNGRGMRKPAIRVAWR
jgi:hypothetical protein